jgi:hypothetical protein
VSQSNLLISHLIINNILINKIIGNDHNTLFWHDSWLLECSLKTRYPLLYDLATEKIITVARYNQLYLFFNRSLDIILNRKLHSLYHSLSETTLSTLHDQLVWRSCYEWLEFGEVNTS